MVATQTWVLSSRLWCRITLILSSDISPVLYLTQNSSGSRLKAELMVSPWQICWKYHMYLTFWGGIMWRRWMSLLYSMRVCGHPIYRTSLPETCSENVCGMERHVAWRDMWHGETCGMERHVAWRDMWHGETCGMERHVVWRDMWHGETCGMERHVAWRDMWHGETCGMERHVAWRDMWSGETCGMERHVAWRDMWHGETCGLERYAAK